MLQEVTETSFSDVAPSLTGDKSIIGAMLSAKENTILRDVVGKNGVYCVQLIKKTAPLKLNSYEPNRMQMQKSMRKDGNTIYNALKDATKIGELTL